VVLLVIVLGRTFELPGLLVAPPLAAALQILLTRLFTPAAAPAAALAGAGQLAALKQRLSAVQDALAALPESSPQLTSLAQRLAKVCAQVEELERHGALERAWTTPETPAENGSRQPVGQMAATGLK
jgi:hypothetical protein